MTPHEWNTALDERVHWRQAYAVVAGEVKAVLDLLQPDPPMTTAQLVECLYPVAAVTDDYRGSIVAAYARRRIFKALAALADHDLADWCAKGTPRKSFGKTVTPLVWFAAKPKEPKTCPHCGAQIEE